MKSLHTREYTALKQWLIRAREAAGLTQQQLADRLGKPQSYVSKIESGERRIDPVELVRHAQALGADPNAAITAIKKIYNPSPSGRGVAARANLRRNSR